MAKNSFAWIGATAGVVIGIAAVDVLAPQSFWGTSVLSAKANKTIPNTTAEANNANTYVPYIDQGFAFVQERDWRSAEISFRKAIQLGCNEASLYNALGKTLYEQGKLAEAVVAYQKAISLNGHFPEAYNNNLGDALGKQGNWKGAIAAYRKAISLDPNSTTSYTNLGNALNKQGSLKEAIAAYQKAVSLNRNDPRAYINLGMALSKQGSREGAIAAFQKARNLYRSRGETQKVTEITQKLKKLGSR